MKVTNGYRKMNSKMVVAGIAVIFGISFMYPVMMWGLAWVHNFLSATKRVETDVLIVESWLWDFMLDDAALEINSGGYTHVLISGFEVAVPEKSKCQSLQSNLEDCKAKLIARGVDAGIIYTHATLRPTNDYTVHRAVAAKKWLTDRQVTAVNIFTGGPHARKSLVIFQKILGKDVRVGVVSSRYRHYDPDRWWTSRSGIKLTLRYLAGYIYALVAI